MADSNANPASHSKFRSGSGPQHLDLSSDAAMRKDATAASRASRPFLGVMFRCCNLYARLYRLDDLTAYSGRCPRCGKRLRVPIGSGGTGQRFFETNS
ncbi:hypothetical protein [Roseimaritima sediminicola]|uniref:hypothetical protein n=1 Tax=Roseimaritima sediminicola TaxID=2662066 RepID=UPI00192A1FB9|nr:hypothetical protein [Roseimaritima sediminicola]